ncbi:glycoside hydrolase family 2 protein [Paenibacillus sp. RS8]|uniref:beta-mannosidase n=1 Tax=Paenibacillus sp. RS8 TaxID=3242681 RepID=UPI0035BEBDA4
MKLTENWKLRDFNVGEVRDLEVASPEFIDYFWMSTTVPGDIHTTLREKGIIEDPFFGHQDQKCRWVEEKVWWYRTVFSYDSDPQPGEKMELLFEGLDTYATVYLNGVELGSTDNMFISHSFDVTRELNHGKNTLAVKFDPIHVHAGDKVQYYWSGFSKKRIWTRKAQSHFGWDWGPRLVCAGIWKEVHLIKRRHAHLDHVFARTTSIQDQVGIVDVDLCAHAFDRECSYTACVELLEGTERVAEAYVSLDRASGITVDGAITARTLHHSVTLRVIDPKLWWTHDLGTPFLYQLRVTLFADGEPIDTYEQRFGIRKIELMQLDEEGRHAFTFVLNGVKVFAKGANWIPIDSFIATVPDSRYTHLLQMAKAANMNMIRAWGGGIYERDIFFDECDRLGILIWQDFMFACALYPDYNRNFMNNVHREIEQVVTRLRSRTSLALWCGNNENDWLYEALSSSGEITHPFYGEKIYHELIPAVLEQLDPTRTFWPSSPFGGNDHNSRDVGDTHNWQVWHGNNEPRQFGEPQTQDYSVEGISFKRFKSDFTKFASEFGLHAASNRYTLAKNMPDNQFYWDSDEMKYRNKDVHYPKGIMLMEGFTGIPKDIYEYIQFSMLTQAEGLRYGIEHYRRNKPDTSGALFWQFNDCWPGTSWSVIDYYGLPKASYHYARKFFAPVLLCVDHDPNGQLQLWAVNDRREIYEDEAELTIYQMDGTIVYQRAFDVTVEANGKINFANLPEAEVLQQYSPREVVAVLRSKKQMTEEYVLYLRDYKDMDYQEAHIQISVDEVKGHIRLISDRVARMVMIELDAPWVIMDDNFFDLIPGEEKTVHVHHAAAGELPWETLRVTAMNDASIQKLRTEGDVLI